MRKHTLQEFRQNDGRVSNLISVYRSLQDGRGGGRRSAQASDTLRAAIVFLHSALEEVFRNLFLWQLPYGSPDALNTIPLKTDPPRHKGFLLGDLLQFESRFIHNVIRESIEAHIDRMSINNLGDLRESLKLIHIETKQFELYYPKLAACMSRRHQIVHQMDRSHERQRAVQSLSARQVADWQDNTRQFVTSLVDAVDGVSRQRHNTVRQTQQTS